jgi:UDP-2-acetamido-3-amino-2,3-dideoxy-glucuronate N-acetyltransferase
MQRSEETSRKRPSVAVVGAGYWGKNLVRNFFDLGVLHVVCDTNPEVLDGVRKKYAVETTQRFEEILSNPGVDAVVIAAPAARHYQLVKESLHGGKDVFVEKPLALGTTEAKELVNLARERSRVLMVGHILQYHPAIVALKRLISEGELGKIQYIYSSRVNLGKLRTEENILWSFAPHDIAAILYLLGETPEQVATHGGSYLNPPLVDTTLTSCSFKSGVKAHIFVSWLHPFKEQKLTIVADKRMAVFDDLDAERKLTLYSHKINWVDRVPVAQKDGGEVVSIPAGEPLRLECEHFLECVQTRQRPRTDGESALRVLEILDGCERSLKEGGKPVAVALQSLAFYAHPTAIVDQPCQIGKGTKIWHFSHVMSGSVLGEGCNLGQNVLVASGVRIGNNVKIQNNVSVYTGVDLEDDVFCGPSMVFTNVINPRSYIIRKNEYKKTLVKRGATLGANSTIVCGVTIGKYALIAAGAVVTRDVPDYALMVGVPARRSGWMCFCGVRLPKGPEAKCSACGRFYAVNGDECKETISESEASLKASLAGGQ